MMNSVEYSGKVALVTNSQYDIGATIVERLMLRGATVFTTYLGATRVDRRLAEDAKLLVQFETDLSNAPLIPALFDRAEETLGPVDVLVNNAVVTRIPSLLSVTAADFDEHVTKQVRTLILTTAEFVRHLSARKALWGRVINVCSFSDEGGRYSYSEQLWDSPVKGALDEITRISARELRSMGITVNAVSPGPPVGVLARQRPSGEIVTTLLPAYTEQQSAIADVVVVLASESGDQISGQIITVDCASAAALLLPTV